MQSEAIRHHDVRNCPNCGSTTGMNFCAECGQETRLHVPSAREFVHEFVGHYVALEGKLWKTLGLLLFRPGRLTLEYLQGRRMRYVQPLRLYLSLSVLFFAFLKYGTMEVIDVGRYDGKPALHAQAGATATRQADLASAPGQDGQDFDGAHTGSRQQLRQWVASWNPKWGDKLARFGAMSSDEQNHLLRSAFFGYVPYAMFVLMPVFALLLKLLYLGSGRRYGEHLLFALHANAFAFLALALLLLTPSSWSYVEGALGLWLTVYLPTAMRRVYGGSRRLTALRWIVLMTMHILGMSIALLGALGFAVVM